MFESGEVADLTAVLAGERRQEQVAKWQRLAFVSSVSESGPAPSGAVPFDLAQRCPQLPSNIVPDCEGAPKINLQQELNCPLLLLLDSRPAGT